MSVCKRGSMFRWSSNTIFPYLTFFFSASPHAWDAESPCATARDVRGTVISVVSCSVPISGLQALALPLLGKPVKQALRWSGEGTRGLGESAGPSAGTLTRPQQNERHKDSSSLRTFVRGLVLLGLVVSHPSSRLPPPAPGHQPPECQLHRSR